ncbi:MAG: bifunctional 4-hydroxy-2-oxoglutarate aldolase/2-dehydro-3-deoxy-phosphogluconate aldolase [Myxococcota bacterium]
MTQHPHHDFLAALWRHRLTAILRTRDEGLASEAMDAAVRGGIRLIEFTMTTPNALGLISRFSTRAGQVTLGGLERLVVGAGTVMTPDQARAAVDAGASFLVSPITDLEVIATANELGVPILPGVHTPTEMVTAHRAGAPLVKLFPMPAGGPTWLRSALAPLPFVRVVPTNGVFLDNIAEWFEAGAWSVGMTTGLFEPADMAAGNFAAIESRAAALRKAAAAVERGPMPEAADPFA